MDISTKEGMRQAVDWQIKHVAMVKEGGVWIVPRSVTMIKLYHSKKLALFVTSDLFNQQEPDIVKVFEAMGWRVKHGVEYKE